MKVILSILFIMLWRVDAQANECNQLKTELAPELTSFIADEYRQLMCSDNAKALGDRLVSNGVSVAEQIYILHIRHPHAPYTSVYARQQKLHFKGKVYKPNQWSFHAVLLINGFIVDPDYTEQSEPTPFDFYMEDMWGDQKFDYVYQIKSFNEYTKNDLKGLFDEDTYSSVSFDQLLDIVSTTACRHE